MGDGDSVGWDNEIGEGDKDRAEGGLSAEAESSENLRREDRRSGRRENSKKKKEEEESHGLGLG